MPTKNTLSRTRATQTASGRRASPHNGDYGSYGVVLAFPARLPNPGTRAQSLVADFLTCHRGNTAAAYRRDLADYLAYCHRHALDPLRARRVDLARYLQDCEDRPLAPATIARRLTAVKGFYLYCHDEDLIPAPPAARLTYRRQRSQTRIHALTAAELSTLLTAADQHCPRTSALTWLLATTGLRISEACSARLENLRHTSDGTWLDVTCKGGVRRSVPVLAPALQRIQLWTREAPSGPVFATRTGTPLDRHAAARTLRAVAAAVGIAPFSPHVLRHTFVTLARANGCALEDVQDAAGHADPATTRRYDRTVAGTARHPGLPLLATLTDHGRNGTSDLADHD
ncbi:tyrosine-type recombinase/integrase [Pedococcus sp. 5OH_020]|uniref:tyrosine-type recombinase/integrase n=1 Tax=Pedococcus sp. 5OH_020 TaxID=2989814 RepID=UPI0022E9B5F9|nr:tyrosine-type recombinase/integrase [Pedococcus sp. 5OH_020]